MARPMTRIVSAKLLLMAVRGCRVFFAACLLTALCASSGSAQRVPLQLTDTDITVSCRDGWRSAWRGPTRPGSGGWYDCTTGEIAIAFSEHGVGNLGAPLLGECGITGNVRNGQAAGGFTLSRSDGRRSTAISGYANLSEMFASATAPWHPHVHGGCQVTCKGNFLPPVCPTWNGYCEGISNPGELQPGDLFSVNITYRNSGNTTWRAGEGFKLGLDPTWPNNYPWSTGRVIVPHDVPPGGAVTFTITERAPAAPGVYPLVYKPLQEMVRWFGYPCGLPVIVKAQPTPTPTSTATNTPTPTFTRTFTPTFTPTFTATSTPTRSPTATRTPTSTFTSTAMPATSTATPTGTATPPPTSTVTLAPTSTGTPTPTPTPTKKSCPNSCPPRINLTTQCVVPDADGTLHAFFGYTNTPGNAVAIPLSPTGNFLTGALSGQPVEAFYEGEHPAAFSVRFEVGSTVTWTVKQGELPSSSTSADIETPLCEAVIPIPICIDRTPNGEMAHFGYENLNPFAVPLPVGSLNRFREPLAANQGQPTVFQPGAFQDVVTVPLAPDGTAVWELFSIEGIADEAVPQCQ